MKIKKIRKNGQRTLSFILSLIMVFSTCIFAGMPIASLKAQAVVASNALRVDEDGNFTILQVADMQGCYPLPDQWLNALRLSIAASEPDLIVMTGDNVTSNAYSEGVWHTLDQIVREFVDMNGNPIPFTLTTGNHDYDSNLNDTPQTSEEHNYDYNYDSKHKWVPEDFYNFCKDGSYANGKKERTAAKGYKGFKADNQDFNGYDNFVDYDKGVGYEKGTGYIDIYSNDGTAVVERVIIMNTGSYDDNGGYGKAGYAVGYNSNGYNKDNKYTEVVNAVDGWTSDATIKCIAFQHIPLREFYGGDSASTSILTRSTSQTNSSYIKGFGSVGDSTITSGWYAPNTTGNSTVSGSYTETCSCSYGDTSAMYNALAKNNVAGIFYGHDHGNTLTGVTTIGGKTLRQGYGGGLNTDANGAKVSMFSYYTLNQDYSGIDDNANFTKVSSDYSGYLTKIGATYGTKTYAPNSVQYIKQLGLEYAPHSIFQQRSFEKALENLGNSYTPLRHMYNDSDADADFNKTTGSSTDDVCIGYKTTTNPAEAITGIIGYRTGSYDHPSEITVDLQNGHTVTYYLEDNDVDCSGGISKYFTLVYYTKDPMAGPPITNLYMTYDYDFAQSWSQFNMKTGESIGDYKVCSWLSDDLSKLEEWRAFDFNTGCGSKTCFLYLEYSSKNGTEDVTREYYDILTAYNKYGKIYDSQHQMYTEESYSNYDTARNETAEFIEELKSPYSPHNGETIRNILINKLMFYYNALELKSSDNSRQIKTSDSQYNDLKVCVPETIYLVPGNSQLPDVYLNNKIDDDGAIVADGATSDTGKFEIRCDDAEKIQVAVKRMIPQSSGQRFQFSEDKSATSSYYYAYNTVNNHAHNLYMLATINGQGGQHISGGIDNAEPIYPNLTPAVDTTKDTRYLSGTISDFWIEDNTVAAGSTGMLEWQFTIEHTNGTTSTAYAYTTIYAPSLQVAAVMGATIYVNTWHEENYLTSTTWITGGHSVYEGSGTTALSALRNNETKNFNNKKRAFYGNPLLEGSAVLTGGNNSANDDDPDMPPGLVDGTEMFACEYNADGYGKLLYLSGYTAGISVDTSRFSNYSQIPNLYIGNDINWNRNTDRINSSHNSMFYSVSDSSKSEALTPLVLGNRVSKHIEGTITQGVHTFQAEVYGYYKENNKSDVGMQELVYLDTDTVDKAPLRKLIGKYEALSPQKNWLESGQESKYTEYMNALVNASYAVGNPANSSVLNTVEGAFNQLVNNQKRSDTINGQTVKFFTTEVNYELRGVLDGYGQRTGYRVYNPPLVELYKYEGKNNAGIGSLENILVKPYDFVADYGYNYLGWMDGEGFMRKYAVVDGDDIWADITEGKCPRVGDTVNEHMLMNLYTDFDGGTDSNNYKHPTADPVNYGHVTKYEVEHKQNEFYFYYKKADHTLTFDLDGGQFTYNGTTYNNSDAAHTWKVTAAEDDSFTIGIIPTRGNDYIFVGWELVDDEDENNPPPYGTYNPATNEYIFGNGNDTIKAVWAKRSTLYIDSNGGYSNNNLIYLPEGRSIYYASSSDMNATFTYEDDGDITITGERTNTDSGERVLNNVLYVYLEYGKSYTFSYDTNIWQTDFYVFAPNGKHCNFMTGATVTYSDGMYHYTKEVTVGTNNGDSSWGNAGVETATLTGVYSMRIDQDAYTGKQLDVRNLCIKERDPQAETTENQNTPDNRIIQFEGTTRMIQNPQKRTDGYIFGGWEVYNMNGDVFGTKIGDTENPEQILDYIRQNSSGCYTFTYNNKNIGLKVIWIKPIGVALDNMFNFYAFRYNEKSPKIAGCTSTNDIVKFDNVNQTITVKDDGQPCTRDVSNKYDIYTAYGGSGEYYNMPLPTFTNEDGSSQTCSYYLLTMDIAVTGGGRAQWFVFNYNSSHAAITSDTYKGSRTSFSSGAAVLASDYPSKSNTHVSKIVQVTDNTAFLQMRFGVADSGTQAVFSNIRLVPINNYTSTASGSVNATAEILSNDTLGYAYDSLLTPPSDARIVPETATYNCMEGESLGETRLYTPERHGYSFIGWTENNSDERFSANTRLEDRDVNVWSRWSADEFLLQYNENPTEETETVSNMPSEGADITSPLSWTLIYDKETKAATDKVISSAVPINTSQNNDKENVFVGWNTKADGSGDTFYPGQDIPRKTINALYELKQATSVNGENKNVLTLYAVWYNVKPAKDDAARNNSDLKQLDTNIVRGVSVDTDGKYASTLLEMKKVEGVLTPVVLTKFDETLHKTYTDAINALNNASSAHKSSVTATTVENLENSCDDVIAAAGVLENTESQNEVVDTYNNNFIVKKGDTETTYTLADMNLNHYKIAKLNEAKTAKSDANTDAYSSGTTLRKAFDSVTDSKGSGSAQAKLNTAVETMAKAFVTKATATELKVAPNYQMYESHSAVQQLLDNKDLTGVNFVMEEAGSFTYHCYTNSLNPTIVLDVDEATVSETAGGKTYDRACYPTTAKLVSSSSDSASIDDNISAENETYSEFLNEQIGTAKLNEKSNYYNWKSRITLHPNFGDGSIPNDVGDSVRKTATYTFESYDDSYVPDGKNYAQKGKTASNKFTNNAEVSFTGTKVNIIIYYKPANGLSVTAEQWGGDKWLHQFHLFRTSGGANNWEIFGWDAANIADATKDGGNAKPINIYPVYDEVYGQAAKRGETYGSFIYTFNVKSVADSTLNTAVKNWNGKDNVVPVANSEVLTNENIEKAVIHLFSYTDDSGNNYGLANYKAAKANGWSGTDTGGTGLGFVEWPGTASWSCNYYPRSRAYTYVHLIDRWGNVFDEVFECPNLDPKAVKANTASVGSAVIEESGGSGINTMTLSGSFEIITDENSELNGNVYKTTGNTVKLYTGEANRSYSLSMTDHAENASTASVKSDADGYIVFDISDTEHSGGVYTFSLNGYEINLFDGVAKDGAVVDVDYTPALGTRNVYKVKVTDRANMVQFIELGSGNGTGTRSYDRHHDSVEITSYDEQGNEVSDSSRKLSYEIWTIELSLADGLTGVRVKTRGSSKWEDKSLAYTFENQYKEADSDVKSAALSKESGSAGAVPFTVVTGADAQAVQLKNGIGETTTVTSDKAIDNKDGTLTFTGRIWFHGTGVQTATVRVLDAYGWKDVTTVSYTIE